NLSWLSREETEAVAEDLGVSAREVTEMEKRLSGVDIAFDPGPADDDDYAPVAYLPSPDADPAAAAEAGDWEADQHERLAAALEGLDARSRTILMRRWLAEGKSTLHELAEEFGVSAERIRQIEASAIRKLKTHLEAA
ncbi:MAG TPA: sigma-70 family RNA polymerase sigma factor, partial [Gammaproteobacteria bacterium]|nr:sigma-70 family RNA polymerase sigma factor [Gammaproteobacteria bacterium]